MFALDWFNELIGRMFPSKILIEERFLALAMPVAARYVSLFMTVFAILAGICTIRWTLIGGLSRSWRKGPIVDGQRVASSRDSALIWSAVAAFGVQGLFTMAWEA